MIVSTVSNNVPGVCSCPNGAYPDTGIIVNGNPSFLTQGLPVAQVQGLVMFSCGTAVIQPGPSNIIISGIPVAKLGFTATGGGCPSGTISAQSLIKSL